MQWLRLDQQCGERVPQCARVSQQFLPRPDRSRGGCETAAFHALQPYCEGDEITVGTAISVEHRAASGVGARVRAEAVLESFDGKFYSVRVSARDDVKEIGGGTVGRAVVSVGKFLEKLKRGNR